MADQDEIILSVSEVTKIYSLWSSPLKRFGHLLLSVFSLRTSSELRKSRRKVEALTGVTFSLRRGESIGIIGRNGSGKSTLLQILAGTLQATNGTKEVKGRIGAILELGSGFHPDFTGRENLKMGMSLLGISRREAKRLEPEIIEFAELGHAMDQPIKTYSQGMILRLAFAMQTSIKPDILLIDEALSVGDVFFQQKCAERVKALQEQGTAFVLVSHDTGAVRHYCQKALFLDQGKQVFYGDTDKAIHYYHRMNGKEDWTELELAEMEEGVDKHVMAPGHHEEFWLNKDQSELEHEAGRITKVTIADEAGKPVWYSEVGKRIIIQVHCKGQSSEPFNVGLKMKDRYGQLVVGFGANTAGVKVEMHDLKAEIIFEIEMECSLQPGEYTLCFHLQETKAAESARGENRLDSRFETPWLGPFQIRWDHTDRILPFHGMFGPKYSCKVSKGEC